MCDCKITLSFYVTETSEHGVLRLKESEEEHYLCREGYIPTHYFNTKIQKKRKKKTHIGVTHTDNP